VNSVDPSSLASLLDRLAAGEVDPATAFDQLSRLDVDHSPAGRLDRQRLARTGLPEAVYGPGKTPAECARLVAGLLEAPGIPVLLTRSSPDQRERALERCPGGEVVGDPDRPSATVLWRPLAPTGRQVLVVTGGTTDRPVADECSATLRALGHDVVVELDCGVAGLQRILALEDALRGADAVVVVAGMEGALASVVAGLVRGFVVGVPTSTGYGASAGGWTALAGMAASCAPGLALVGIDNGFGAACVVHRALGASRAVAR